MASSRNTPYMNLPLTLSAEFDFRAVGDGRSAAARYANNSNYRNDSLIRKESEFIITYRESDPSCLINADRRILSVHVSSLMIQEIKRIIKESEIMKYGHDLLWRAPDFRH